MRGVRFRVFPQPFENYAEPELVEVGLPPGAIGPGPSDVSMYVADAVDKTEPYDPPSYLPPYEGAVFSPAVPDAAGHFDWIPVDHPQFRAAHVYAVVRLNLDRWQRYLGRPIEWWFADSHPRMELIPRVTWPNAQSGPGLLEAGEMADGFGGLDQFWMNFDVLAHETGHITLFSTIGVPAPDAVHGAFLAFHEAFADLFAVTGTLQFRSVRERLLAETQGDLYVLNLVSRVGELSRWSQIRVASNTAVMADVDGVFLGPDGAWVDPAGRGRGLFDYAAPLTGAVFDILVEVFQDGLAARGLVPDDAGGGGWTRREVEASLARVSRASRLGYQRFSAGFEAALDEARDVVCLCMAHVMHTLRPETLTFATVAARFLEGAGAAGLTPLMPRLLGHFLARGIDPRPHLGRPSAAMRPMRRRPSKAAHAAGPARPHCRACGNAAAFILAGRLMRHENRSCEAVNTASGTS